MREAIWERRERDERWAGCLKEKMREIGGMREMRDVLERLREMETRERYARIHLSILKLSKSSTDEIHSILTGEHIPNSWNRKAQRRRCQS